MKILGVDNGLDGGLVLLTDGWPEWRIAMPTLELSGKRSKTTGKIGKRRIYYEDAIRQNLLDWSPQHVFIEVAQPMPDQGVTSMFTTGLGFGLMRGICVGLGLSYTLVHPRTWQAMLFRGLPKPVTKDCAKVVAGRLWPGLDWRATTRCKVPHSGVCDAACIAYYGHRMMGGGPGRDPDFEVVGDAEERAVPF